jgi:MFS family permease
VTARRDAGVVEVLRNQAFLRLWVVQAMSQTAQNMINFSLLILVRQIVETQHLSQANTAISLLVLAFSSPAVLFSAVAGVVVERADKRTVMIASNALRVVGVLGFLVLNPDWPPLLTLAVLYFLTFFLGTVGQFFGPAQAAAIPVIVNPRELMSANALFNLTFTGSQIIGFAALGPIAIKVLGVQNTLIGILVLYVLSTGLALLLPKTPPIPRDEPDETAALRRFIDDAREGVVFVLQSPLLIKAIVYLTMATTTYLMIAALGPEFIVTVLKLPSEDIAYVVAPAGLGVVAGALLVNRVARFIRPVRLVDYGLISAGIWLALFALSEPIGGIFGFGGENVARGIILFAVGCAAMLGISNAFVLVPSQTLLQAGSPQEGLARVYATYFTISNVASFAPVLFAGAFADLFGVLKVIIFIAVLLVIIGVYNLRHTIPGLPDHPATTPATPDPTG